MQHEITIVLDAARVDDVNELLSIYRIIYGSTYPLSYGTDPAVLRAAIEDKEGHYVLVARVVEDEAIAGIAILEIEPRHKLGKVVGVAVHPSYQRHKIAHRLVSRITQKFLEEEKELNSLYATTRTLTVGPQVVFYRNGYLPLGIFPNAHRLSRYESVTLMARFREGVLGKRDTSQPASECVRKLFANISAYVPDLVLPDFAPLDESKVETAEEEWSFEVIRAPEYVLRRFNETFVDDSNYFFPFTKPNIIFSETKGRMEIFGNFSQIDGYCVLIAYTGTFADYKGPIHSLFTLADSIGISYLEVLVRTTSTPAINSLLKWQFLPSALYPALKEVDGKPIDYLIMSRTMEPLNFDGMAVISPFKPYLDQYVESWKKAYLDTLQIVYGPEA